MPVNDSGYELTVGPDHEGRFFSVAPGEQFDIPVPPQDETPEPAVPETPPQEEAKPVKGDTGKDAAR